MGWIRIWDQQENCYSRKILSRSINDIAISQDLNWLAYSEESDPVQETQDYINYVQDPKVWVVNLKHNAKQFRLEEKTNFINCLKFTQSNLLVSSSKDLNIRIWSVSNRKLLQRIPCYHEIVHLSIHHLEYFLGAISKLFCIIHIYYTKNGKLKQFWKTNLLSSISISFSYSGHMLLTEGLNDKNRQIYQLWNIQTKKMLRTFKGSLNSIKIAQFSQNDQQLVIKNNDNKIAFVDISKGEEIKIYEKVEADAQICFSRDCKTMVCDDLWQRVFVYTM
ncbi:unnamed protein product [Paramecium primaurelia]|uniref:Uncharacterized protein n=1 Tax=Paramecium primaurelia TaxID=5886 RepID=A0A8S1QX88_PARPR|nr:unnamed protein product [Paramecium primaurelia]